MNHEAEEWVEKYWEKGGKHCEECPFLHTWTEHGGEPFSECRIVEGGDAEDCPAWMNEPEGGDDE